MPEAIDEQELDDYLAKLDEQLELKKKLTDEYDPTDFYLGQK